MSFRIAIRFIIMTAVIETAVSNTALTFGPTEYCHRDAFNVTCGHNAVIIITQALLGRIKLGGCVKRDLGFMPCSKDVTAILGSQCSGRQHCELQVQDSSIYDPNPCPDDTTSHLEVTYQCLQVASAPANRCLRPIEITAKLPGDQTGYISTVISERLGVGTSRCPWQIAVNPGQRVNITLFTFVNYSNGKGAGTDIREDACYEIANVREYNSQVKRNILACILEQSEVKLTSQSHILTISLPHRNTLHNYGAFLLKYEAVGCPDIRGTGDSVVTVDNGAKSATIKCPHTGKVWYLTCGGTSWIGKAGNCTGIPEVDDPGSVDKFFQHNTFPYALLIAVSIGVALGVFLGGLLLTVVAMHNKRKRQMNQPPDTDSVYYDSKMHAHYCELNGLQHQHHTMHCHNHTRTPDVASTRSVDVSEHSETRDYFLKPDPDLFCTIDRTYERNKLSDKPQYGVSQER